MVRAVRHTRCLSRSDQQLQSDEIRVADLRSGSAAPVQLTKLLTYRLHPLSIGTGCPWATALENGRARLAVALWWLYFETGHRRHELLFAQITGSGRVCEVTNCRFVEAKLEKPALGIGQLWRSLTGGYGSFAGPGPPRVARRKYISHLSFRPG